MEKQLNELLERTARIEVHTEYTKNSLIDQDKRLKSLEVKWYSSMGAIVISLVSIIKSFVTNG